MSSKKRAWRSAVCRPAVPDSSCQRLRPCFTMIPVATRPDAAQVIGLRPTKADGPMSFILKCPSCQSPLRIRPEYAGKQLKCPRCANVLSIPLEQPADDEPQEVEPPRAEIQARGRSVPSVLPPEDEGIESDEKPLRVRPVRRPRDEDDEDDRDAPRRGRPRLSYKPCPRCGGTEATKVVWTFWGSFYGPAMFTHVRCLECGTAYNGRTGRSNLIPAVIMVTIPALLIATIVGFLAFVVIGAMRGR